MHHAERKGMKLWLKVGTVSAGSVKWCELWQPQQAWAVSSTAVQGQVWTLPQKERLWKAAGLVGGQM